MSLSLLSISISFVLCPFYSQASTLEQSLILAEEYSEDQHLKGYWYSEKLDGIRALWTGKELLTRKGNKIVAPDWFYKALPGIPLEGELWAGRGNFYKVQQTVLTSQPSDVAWKDIRFMLFDIPGSKKTYRQRYQRLLDLEVVAKANFVKVIRQYAIESQHQLSHLFNETDKNGAEGLMLRNPDSVYRQGRSNDLIKLKKHQDAEAMVVGYRAGKGKYTGMTGSLLVRQKNGKQFYIGSGLSEQLRKHPPAIGEVITFRFNGMTSKGLPRFARFIRVVPKN
ncbi:DNA ligase [Vibrio sp. SCSIO 43137]|uniref:DNA ligase n=1 Tax=Vibrio sp. SCSIO 43137 TaxID=3021011 RepID=UPI003FCC6942